VFRMGLGVFTLASLLGGLGMSAEHLIAARGLQGIGAALAAPNALALIATTFPVGKPRNSAMAVYAAMSAVGITAGVLLGGVLTGMLSWRWVFFITEVYRRHFCSVAPERGHGGGTMATASVVYAA
jgi:MFS family permease